MPRREEHIREDVHVHLHVHFHEPIVVNVTMLETPTPPTTGAAVSATLTTTGGNMGITVDTTNETVAVDFVDDKGNDTGAPSGAVATFSVDNPAVATINNDTANPLQGDISPVGVGTVTISCAFNGTALEADGTTPIADPSPVTLQVDAGAAVGSRLVLSTP